MFRFIHAADIHLDSPLRGLELPEDAPLDEIRSASRRALENMVDLAIREEVAFVLIAGDLYDGDWRDFHTGLFFNKCMQKLENKDIRVFVVSGNHDADNRMTKTLQLPDNVYKFSSRKPKTVTIDDLKVAVHGQSFGNRSVLDNLSSDYPAAKKDYFNIGLLHTALSGREGHEPYAPCTLDDLTSKGYQYWALGHVHNREVVHDDPWVVFPGNIQGRHIRESGAKGCTMVTVEDDQVTAAEHIDLDVILWTLHEEDISECQNTDEVLDRVQKVFEVAGRDYGGRPVIIRLHLTGNTDAHQKLHAQSAFWTDKFRAVASDVGREGVWLEKVKFRTTAKTDIETLFQEDTPIGMLLRNLKGLAMSTEDLNNIDPEMTSFLSKLPSEMQGGDDPFDPADPEQLEDIVSDVRELLTARLIKEGQNK